MIMTIRIISNFFFGWLSPNNTYGYPPMFPINPSCWWLNTAFLALLAPTACISPGFTIRIAAWHSSLVTSPYQYLRHGGSWATQRHESWKILHVFLRPFYTIWCCVMKWNIISMDIYGNFLSPNRTIRDLFEEDKRFPQEIANFATRNWHVGALQDDDLVTKSGPTRPEQQIHDGVSGFLCVFILMFSPSIVGFLIKIPITIPLLPMDWLTASWSNCNSIDFWNYFQWLYDY